MTMILILLALAFCLWLVFAAFKKKAALPQPPISAERLILQQHVAFYQQLEAGDRSAFEDRIRLFLSKVRITGVGTAVEDIDRVFVAAGAIIPIFAFKDWEYRNIDEVLLYPGSFSDDFRQEGTDRNVLGMVGNGPLQRVMILSRQELRDGFLQPQTKSNTAIHEFVHLVDKADGDVDGIPEALVSRKYALPWLKRIHEEIGLIHAGRSDINPYAATNEAEFLAVAAEYFFEQPHLMAERHPDLYQLLREIFLPRSI